MCQLISSNVVEVNEQGEPLILDIELEWDPCPGDQYQAVRGGAQFAACMSNYHVGQLLPVLVEHWWDSRGYYRWDVYKVGACERTVEPDSEGSYEKSQDFETRSPTGGRRAFCATEGAHRDSPRLARG